MLCSQPQTQLFFIYSETVIFSYHGVSLVHLTRFLDQKLNVHLTFHVLHKVVRATLYVQYLQNKQEVKK